MVGSGGSCVVVVVRWGMCFVIFWVRCGLRMLVFFLSRLVRSIGVLLV